MRGLNCHERYHARELMSFYFIFVTNFIHDKNPLYGTCIAIWLHLPGNHPGSHLTVILKVLTIIPQLLYLTSLITLICYIGVLGSCHFVITCITPFEVKFIDFIQGLSYFLIMVGSAFFKLSHLSTVVWEKFHVKNFCCW